MDELNELINCIEKKDTVIKQQAALIADITTAVGEIVEGMSSDEEFIRSLLNCMVVNDKDHIDVYLNLLPYKWSYTVAKAINAAEIENSNIEINDSNAAEKVRHFRIAGRYRRTCAPRDGRHNSASAYTARHAGGHRGRRH